MSNKIQVINIYNKIYYKRVELPDVSEETFTFSLNKEDFGLVENVYIEMVVLDRAWCFGEATQFVIKRKKELVFLKKLKEQEELYLETSNRENFVVMISCEDSTIPVYDKYLLSKENTIFAGHVFDNTLCVANNGLNSKKHFKISWQDGNWLLSDFSTNGTYINGKRVHEKAVLNFGDKIECFGFFMIFLRDLLVIPTNLLYMPIGEKLTKVDRESLKWITHLPMFSADKIKDQGSFHRPPRSIAKYEDGDFEIEAPPMPREMEKKSLFMTIGPSLTMGIPMLVSFIVMGSGGILPGIAMMFSSAGIGAFWALKNIKEQQKRVEREEKKRFDKYREYLTKKEAELRKIYLYNMEELNKMYGNPKSYMEADYYNSFLWNRNMSHEDFLSYRLGVGEMNLQAKIKIPTERFQLIDDSLQNEPKRIKETYDKLKNVPITINLGAEKLIGVVGGKEKSGVYQVVRNLIAQIAISNSYSDVKIVMLGDKKNDEHQKLFDSIKWLPHFWDDNQQIRFMADDEESRNDVVYSLLPEMRRRKEANDGNGHVFFEPWFVFISLNTWDIVNSQLSSFLLEKDNRVSATTILCVDSYENLPNECEKIIQNDDAFQGMYSVRDAQKEWINIAFDQVTYEEFVKFSHKLAPIRVSSTESESGMPDTLTFLEMYGVHALEELNVKERWQRNLNYDSMKVPIGMKSGGNICYLDIHEKAHGPHGLVAGTTGSGKSEVLQSYLLSLAVNFSPEDVNFFIIDFKGGGMANLFNNLPHMVGEISNLSGNQIRRAMVSIMSENARRQRIFGENGVNNISEYTKLYRNHEVNVPLPHLLIIIDEFAELKREQPEFMAELISVAAIGRSLGVHLILATQKPSGTVDEKIWSNTRFRLCLRVADKQDSNDMLHKPDAAFITQAGRGYLQVGEDEIYEQFQSAWSGALFDSADIAETEDIAQIYKINGKTILTGNHQKMKRKLETRVKWISKLYCIWKEVLQESDCNTKRYLVNNKARKDVNKRLFDSFAQKKINITENSFTINRLLDFATICENCERDQSLKNDLDYVHKIIELADATGRKLPEVKRRTELDAIVDYLQIVAGKEELLPKTKLWLPCLEEILVQEEIPQESDEKEWSLDVCVGKYDDPEHQYQGEVSVDFANQGNYLVCGTVGTGKSITLQTIVYLLIQKYSPKKINIYGIDFSSGMLECFREAPHVGGIMNEQNMEEITKFFYMIKDIFAERKNILRGGSYSNYLKQNKEGFPAILIVIDQYALFSERTNQQFDKQILELAKEGSNNGIFLLISGNNIGSGEIPGKLADYIQGSLCLQMNDRYQYSEILKVSRVEVLPVEGIRGRGLVNIRGNILEFQVALAVEASDDYQRSEKIAKVCKNMKETYNGVRAKKIPVIPVNPVFSELIKSKEAQKLLADPWTLPLGYDQKSASIWGPDLRRFFCYIISGKQRTGKRNMLHVIMQSALAKEGKVCVISAGEMIKNRAEELGCDYYSMNEDLGVFCETFIPILTKRNKLKHQMEVSGYSDDEIYAEMAKEQSIFIIVDDMISFVDKIYNPEDGLASYSSFFETFLNKGFLHQIFIFGSLNQEDLSKVYGKTAFDLFARERVGIHFGGNVGCQDLLDFSYIPYREQNQIYPIGEGVLASGSSMMPNGKVVIPLSNK